MIAHPWLAKPALVARAAARPEVNKFQEMFDEKNPVGIFSIIFHIDLNKIFRHRPLMVCLKRQVHIDLNNLFKHRPLPHFYYIPY